MNRGPAERLGELARLVEAGRLRAPEIRTLPLAEAAIALAELAGGHVRGKLVITVDE